VGVKGEGKDDTKEFDVKIEYPLVIEYYGLMSGVLFALPLSIFSIIMGVTSDKVSRKWILCIGCILWSTVSILTGVINSFPIFVILRVLLGICCAFCNPAAYSLIRDYFPPTRRGTANSIYSSGIYIGNALSSASISLIKFYGWRSDFTIPGTIGVALGVAGIIFLREPERGHFSQVKVEAPKKEVK
tara:strand:- start:417 stop:977 length:561 start_codon:yes stop_codon:yes gene_type:complete